MTKPTEGTKYEVGGRYGQYYVDRYINGQMNGTVIGGTTKKNATEAANALNSAYRAGLQDAALFIEEQYEKDIIAQTVCKCGKNHIQWKTNN
jgi:hypothetical protein